MEKVTRLIRLKLDELREEPARRYFGWMRQQRYSEQTQRGAFITLKQLIASLAEKGEALADVTREDLDAYHIALQDRKLSPSTVFHHMAVIRAFFNWLESEGGVFINPAKGLILPKPPRHISYVPSEDDVKKLLAAPRHTPTRACAIAPSWK